MTVFVPEDVLTLRPAQTFDRIRRLLVDIGPDDDTWHARWWAPATPTLMGR